MVVIVGRSNWMYGIWVDRAWDVTLAAGVAAVLCVGRMVAALHLTYHEKLNVLRTKFIPAALHGIEAFFLSQSCYPRLRAAFVRAFWYREMPMAPHWYGSWYAGWQNRRRRKSRRTRTRLCGRPCRRFHNRLLK